MDPVGIILCDKLPFLGDNSALPIHDEIKSLFEKSMRNDPYHNCHINLSGFPKFNEKNVKQTVSKIFSELMKNKEAYHHLIVRISEKHSRLYKCIINKGFTVHHSEERDLLMKKCLGRCKSECVYPPYKTMSIGITVVIFNPDLTLFLAVQEKTGPYSGWKAPTGSVDYDKEDELTAAIREVREETNVHILPEQLLLVAMAPTNNLRGRCPDRNFVYACISNNDDQIKPQEKEIKKVEWISVDEFLSAELPVSHTSRPLILQEVVRVAKESILKNVGWKPGSAFWGSGRDATLYQPQSVLQ